jgi:hypothetical protein
MDTVSDTLTPSVGGTRVDRDVVNRFATCCRSLGLSVNDRQRPADLAAARSGFTELTRIAREQCDAWIGLAAAGAGENSGRVIATIWRTLGTFGALTREIELGAEDLGFTYDTGLYLQFRATSRDDIALAYAATLGEAGEFAEADQLVEELISRRPAWLQARWVRVALYHRSRRWSDVVRTLTPVVNDAKLDDHYAHAARVTLAIALANLGMFAPALSHLENPEGPVAVAAVDGGLV